MVEDYLRRFYGEEILGTWARFEKQLPLLAVGSPFLASHAEPRDFFPRDRVVGTGTIPRWSRGSPGRTTTRRSRGAWPGCWSTTSASRHPPPGTSAGTGRSAGPTACGPRGGTCRSTIPMPSGSPSSVPAPIDPERDVFTIEHRPLAAE